MVKEKRILSYILGWLIIGLCILFVGISNIFALETNFQNLSVKGYDNHGNSLTNPNVFNCSAGSCGMEITTTANSYGGAWAIQSPIPLLSNHTYTLTLRIRNTNGIGITLSSKNRIAVGNSIDSVKHNYETNNYWNTLKTSMATGNYTLQFVFTPTGQASYLLVPFTTTSTTTTSFMIDNIIIDDLGSEAISQEDINNSLNNQTNTLNNSIQNSTNTITGAIDNMEQSIIDSNKETQEVIKDQFNTCRDSKNLWGNLTWQTSTYAYFQLPTLNEDYTLSIKLKEGKTIPSGLYLGFTEKGLYSNVQVTKWLIQNGEFVTNQIKDNFYYINNQNSINRLNYISVFPQNNINSLSEYFDIQLEEGQTFTTFETYGEKYCNNKIDETNDKLDDITGALTDNSAPNTSGLENSAGWLPPGPLDSILNLPLTMLNSLTNSLGKTCSPLNVNLPYVNKNIQIPCLSAIFNQITGVNGLWTWVGTIASVLILYNYLLNLYAWVDRILTLRAEFDEAMGADLANWGRI